MLILKDWLCRGGQMMAPMLQNSFLCPCVCIKYIIIIIIQFFVFRFRNGIDYYTLMFVTLDQQVTKLCIS